MRTAPLIHRPDPIRGYTEREAGEYLKRYARRRVKKRDRFRLAVTYIQNASARAVATFPSASWTSAPTASNILIATVVRYPTAATTLTGVSGASSGAFTNIPGASVTQTVAGVYVLYLDSFYVTAAGGKENITASGSGTGFATTLDIYVYEIPPSVLGQSVTGSGNSSTPATSSGLTVVAGSFALATTLIDNGYGFATGWWTAGNGFTLANQTGGFAESSADMWLNQSGAGTIPGSGNFVPAAGTTGAGPWITNMVTFKPSGGAVADNSAFLMFT